MKVYEIEKTADYKLNEKQLSYLKSKKSHRAGKDKKKGDN